MPDYNEWDENRSKGSSRNKSAPPLVVYGSLLMSLLAIGKVVFFSGSQNGAMEAHLTYDDKRFDSLETRMDRDEARMEPAIELMQETAVEDKEVAENEKAAIQQLQEQISKLRR